MRWTSTGHRAGKLSMLMLTAGMDAVCGSFLGLVVPVLWPDHPRRETNKISGGNMSNCSAVGRIIPACSVTVDVSGATRLRARGECVCCIHTLSSSMLNLCPSVIRVFKRSCHSFARHDSLGACVFTTPRSRKSQPRRFPSNQR